MAKVSIENGEVFVILRRDILEASERILFENIKIAHATYNTFDGMIHQISHIH